MSGLFDKSDGVYIFAMSAKAIFKPGQPAEHVTTQCGYDRWAEIYDSEDNPLIALEEPRVAELLGSVSGLEVLDLGCGTGRHTLPLVHAGARVTAMDFADQMVARAAAKPGWEQVRFIRHDLTQPFPMADQSFDRVCSFLVLDHVSDLTRFFGECRRVCRPSGFILLSTVHPAMMLRGIVAHFTDPRSGKDVCPASIPNQISDYVMAALNSGLRLIHVGEHSVDASLAAKSARAAKYEGWPMLLMLKLGF